LGRRVAGDEARLARIMWWSAAMPSGVADSVSNSAGGRWRWPQALTWRATA
jgi:hypothetical protein